MYSRTSFIALLASFLISILTSLANAQDANAVVDEPPIRPVTVGVYVHPPFVMKEDGRYTGMAIDLWEESAHQLNLQTEYVEMNNVGALIQATQTGKVDAAVTNMSVTRDRAERIDFTHPWFDAGQRIMVTKGHGAGFWDLVQGLRDSGHLRAYGWLALVILTATILMTFFDRRFDEDFPKRWRDGFAESFYTVMTVATSGKPVSRKNLFGWIGRIWQAAWLVCGVAVLAYVTSSVTSVMTTLSLTSQITSVDDLSGRTVGVQPGSVSEVYARENGINALPFDQIEKAVDALIRGQIDAIIGDAPVLEYYAHVHTDKPVIVVGSIFEPDKYAFGLRNGSDLTRRLSVELIGASENGRIEEVRKQYFGDEND
ncbi:transporter substrate-binding domain-containing protein [Brucella intermedia]|uniref:transporter substrate-binding domain-containing protein n=1 Tax=Brucella TaxID=234 RepID=UPI00094680F7|nr:transporter substrate-binding domain-containing protein [Brucella intermedia]